MVIGKLAFVILSVVLMYDMYDTGMPDDPVNDTIKKKYNDGCVKTSTFITGFSIRTYTRRDPYPNVFMNCEKYYEDTTGFPICEGLEDWQELPFNQSDYCVRIHDHNIRCEIRKITKLRVEVGYNVSGITYPFCSNRFYAMCGGEKLCEDTTIKCNKTFNEYISTHAYLRTYRSQKLSVHRDIPNKYFEMDFCYCHNLEYHYTFDTYKQILYVMAIFVLVIINLFAIVI